MSEKDPQEKFLTWLRKIDLLKDQINKLSLLEDFPIILISAFMLKSQLVEFELKQTISAIEIHLSISNPSSVVKLNSRSPRDFDESKFTLGRLTNELLHYQNSEILTLEPKIRELVSLRNSFVHDLFSSKHTLYDLNSLAAKGIVLADEILLGLERINIELHNS